MKIIGTIGPRSNEKKVIKELIDGGVDVFRLNFSHGDFEEFEKIINYIKVVGKDVHIMGDLSGGKIRVSDKLPYIYKIYNGDEIYFCGEDNYHPNKRWDLEKVIPLNLNSTWINENTIKTISMKDNTMNFKIIDYSDGKIKARVKRGGIIRRGKGCNIKNLNRRKGIITKKDRGYLDWAIKNNIDIICQSFVEEVEDIEVIKSYINKESGYKPKIWAKIETPLGIENSKEIGECVDGIVLGRGDLIPESSLIEAPVHQERFLRKLEEFSKRKDLIIGTHILNSMKNGRRPELAEVESIYNFIKKGANGFLLSGEVSIGKAPVKTVGFLKALIESYRE